MNASAARDAPGDSLLVAGTLVASRFRVAQLIGRGGMGAVYEAEDVVIGRAVALKVLTVFDQRALDRFLGEARAASRISSRHVSAVHDFGHDPQHGSYIVMELLQGEPLDQVLSRRGSLTPAVAAAVGADIAEALAAAHAAGVVHRDLKPSNVWMLRDGGLKVIDFGIARVVDSATADGSAPDRTAPDVILGTPLYISPEAVRGDDVGSAADLYALGVMLFEMAAGSTPFWDEVPLALCTKHLRDPPPALSAVRPDLSLPEGYAALVGGLLEKDPKRRPRSAREVADLLRPMCDLEGPLRLAGDGGAAGAPTASIARPRSRSRLLVAIAVAVPALAALAVMGAVASGLAGDEQARPGLDDPAVPVVALPSEPVPPEPPTARESVPSTIRIDVRVTPSGATIQLDGEPAAPPFELANDGAEHALEITRAGYSSEQRTLRADRDQSLEIVLRRRSRRRPLPAKLREW